MSDSETTLSTHTEEELLTRARRIRGGVKASCTTLRKNFDRLKSKGSKLVTPEEVERLIKQLNQIDNNFDKAQEEVVLNSPLVEGEIPMKECEYADLFKEQVEELNADLSKLLLQTQASRKANRFEVAFNPWKDQSEEDWRKRSSAYPSLKTHFEDFCMVTQDAAVRECEDLLRLLDLSTPIMTRIEMAIESGSPGPAATPSSASGLVVSAPMRPPTVPLPTFDGDPMEWPTFFQAFQAGLKKYRVEDEADKAFYLAGAIRNREAKRIIETEVKDGSYDLILKKLLAEYDDKRLYFRKLIESLRIDKEGDTPMDTLERWKSNFMGTVRRLQNDPHFTAEQIIVAYGELQMGPTLFKEWSRFTAQMTSVPHLKDLEEFTKDCKRLFDAAPGQVKSTVVKSHSSKHQPTPSTGQRKSKPVLVAQHQTQQETVKSCCVCKHPMRQCPAFLKMNPDTRTKKVRELGCCSNCLAISHTVDNCYSRHSCWTCHKRHHTLLHSKKDDPPTSKNNSQPASSNPTSTKSTVVTDPAATDDNPITPMPTNTLQDKSIPPPGEGSFMPTTMVRIIGRGRDKVIRGFVDTGSSISCISSRVANAVSAKKEHHIVRFAPFSPNNDTSQTHTSRTAVKIKIQSLYNKESVVEAYLSVVDRVAGILPVTYLQGAKESLHQQFPQIDFADEDFDRPGSVDLLIGNDILHHYLINASVLHKVGSLVAQETCLGYLVSGTISSSKSGDYPACHVSFVPQASLPDISSFWEMEEIPTKKTHSEEESLALESFSSTHRRLPDGGYSVALPRRPDAPLLGDSRQQAVRRLHSNSKTLIRKGTLPQFQKCIDEYFELNHAELVPSTDLQKPCHETFYLPMHGVVKESSTTTKLRVVFDGSAKTSTGVSLNEVLVPGPCSYPAIPDILLKFRRHRIGFTADIEKMFRMITLQPQERDLHRFVYQTSPDSPVVDARMTRLTFGINCSPFLATAVLHQLAQDYGQDHPEAAGVVTEEFYVDDLLSGADTPEQAQHLQQELCSLLSKGKMVLRKWRTNSQQVRDSIPAEIREDSDCSQQIPTLAPKALGVHWSATSDHLHISTPALSPTQNVTKRTISSGLAQVFDVLGLFSPVLLKAKSLFQRLWIKGLGWDDTVPENIRKEWLQWTEQLPVISSHPVQRCYFQPNKSVESTQLHGFSDASQHGYAGAIYLRITYSDGSIDSVLLYARTKVAPVKVLTIPRLELSGALLLAQSMEYVASILKISLDGAIAWTDSSIVLSWLDTQPVRLKVFEGNRVAQITAILPSAQWRHVASKSNPADLASRGLYPEDLISRTLWWKGPEWLSLPCHSWPPSKIKVPEDLPGLRSKPIVSVSVQREFCEGYVSYKHLLRIVGWILRFYRNLTRPPQERKLCPHLDAMDICQAEIRVIHQHQVTYFMEDIHSVKEGHNLGKGSKIRHLMPNLNGSNLLVVGGRLGHADLPAMQKHPFILYGRSHLSHIIIYDLHLENGHAGPSTLIGIVSAKFYMVGMRQAIRSTTRSCILCRKMYARTMHQQLGQLPQERVTPVHPFHCVGIDFAGPFLTKRGNPRRPTMVKTYLCLFICMATKCVHLEAVSDLSAATFLSALKKFIAFRNLPQTIITDNGSNFVSVDLELKAFYDALDDGKTNQAISHYLADNQVQWKRIPPRSPNFGGIWESSIKAAKRLLYNISGNTRYTFEEFTFVLAEVQSILNSRPIVPLEAPAEDGSEALTPSHLLTGRAHRTLPTNFTITKSSSSARRWNLIQGITDQFWSQWKSSYLLHMQRANKWLIPTDNLKVGDVVLCKDLEEFATRTWPLGRITEVHPGTDGKVRVVTLKCHGKTYKRPANKIVLILSEENGSPVLTSQTSTTSSPCQSSPSDS